MIKNIKNKDWRRKQNIWKNSNIEPISEKVIEVDQKNER